MGACAPTHLLVWGHYLDDALDIAVEWAAEHAPGLLSDQYVREEYERIRKEKPDLPEEVAWEEAAIDQTEISGHCIPCDEWGIIAENPTRDKLKQLIAEYGGIEFRL